MENEKQLYCQFRNGLKDIYQARAQQVDKPDVVVKWFYGGTGTGKSREAFRLGSTFGPEDFWVAPLKLDWFDGYTG